jgi:nitroreductase
VLDCLEIIVKRRSVRWFTEENVSREEVEKLIEAANWRLLLETFRLAIL